MDDVFQNIEEYNPGKEHKILIVFDDMIANMHSNEKLNSNWITYQKQKTKHFSCFYYAILFCCTEKR